MSWTWQSIADKALGAIFNGPMKTLENDLALQAKSFPTQDKVVTTDATVTELTAVKIPVNQTVVVRGFVSARRTGGAAGATNDGAGYRVEFVAKNTAGTAALIGAGVVTVLGESQAAWDCTVVASGATISVRVQAAVNNIVSWGWTARSLAIAQ